MISIGHRTKLFDVLSMLPPSTIEDIALKSKLNQRYIKEWLGAMVTGKIVNYDPEKNKFWIEKEKSQYLTRKTSYV